MSRELTDIQRALGVLLERTEGLSDLTKTVTVHEEKFKNLEDNILPPLQDNANEDKKRKWFTEGVRVAVAFLAGLSGGHTS